MQCWSVDILRKIGFEFDWRSLLCYRRTCRRFYSLFNAHFWKEKAEIEFRLIERSYICDICHYLACRKAVIDNWLRYFRMNELILNSGCEIYTMKLINFNRQVYNLEPLPSDKDQISTLIKDYFAEMRIKEKERSLLAKILISYLQKNEPSRFKVYYTYEDSDRLYRIADDAIQNRAQPGNLIINRNPETKSVDRIGYFISADQIAFSDRNSLNIFFPEHFIEIMKNLQLTKEDSYILYSIPDTIQQDLMKVRFAPAQMGTISGLPSISMKDIIEDFTGLNPKRWRLPAKQMSDTIMSLDLSLKSSILTNEDMPPLIENE